MIANLSDPVGMTSDPGNRILEDRRTIGRYAARDCRERNTRLNGQLMATRLMVTLEEIDAELAARSIISHCLAARSAKKGTSQGRRKDRRRLSMMSLLAERALIGLLFLQRVGDFTQQERRP